MWRAALASTRSGRDVVTTAARRATIMVALGRFLVTEVKKERARRCRDFICSARKMSDRRAQVHPERAAAVEIVWILRKR